MEKNTDKVDWVKIYDLRPGEDHATRELRIREYEASRGNRIPDNMSSNVYWKTR